MNIRRSPTTIELLRVIATCTEVPRGISKQIKGSSRTIEENFRMLVKEKYISRIKPTNGEVSYRLTQKGKNVLLEKETYSLIEELRNSEKKYREYFEKEAPELCGNQKQITRLHRQSEAIVLLHNAGVKSYADEKERLSKEKRRGNVSSQFFSSKELKKTFPVQDKYASASRAVGVIATPNETLFVYNTNRYPIKFSADQERKAYKTFNEAIIKSGQIPIEKIERIYGATKNVVEGIIKEAVKGRDWEPHRKEISEALPYIFESSQQKEITRNLERVRSQAAKQRSQETGNPATTGNLSTTGNPSRVSIIDRSTTTRESIKERHRIYIEELYELIYSLQEKTQELQIYRRKRERTSKEETRLRDAVKRNDCEELALIINKEYYLQKVVINKELQKAEEELKERSQELEEVGKEIEKGEAKKTLYKDIKKELWRIYRETVEVYKAGIEAIGIPTEYKQGITKAIKRLEEGNSQSKIEEIEEKERILKKIREALQKTKERYREIEEGRERGAAARELPEIKEIEKEIEKTIEKWSIVSSNERKKAIVIGRDWKAAEEMLSSEERYNGKMLIRADNGIYDEMHYIPNNAEGEKTLKLMLHRSWKERILELLVPKEEQAAEKAYGTGCDIYTKDRIACYCLLDMDLNRLIEIKKWLEQEELKKRELPSYRTNYSIKILCFKYQGETIKKWFGNLLREENYIEIEPEQALAGMEDTKGYGEWETREAQLRASIKKS